MPYALPDAWAHGPWQGTPWMWVPDDGVHWLQHREEHEHE